MEDILQIIQNHDGFWQFAKKYEEGKWWVPRKVLESWKKYKALVQLYLMENELSNKETPKDDGIREAVPNHNKTMIAEEPSTPSKWLNWKWLRSIVPTLMNPIQLLCEEIFQQKNGMTNKREAVPNHNTTMIAEVRSTPSNACIDHEVVDLEATQTDGANLEEQEAVQTPKL